MPRGGKRKGGEGGRPKVDDAARREAQRGVRFSGAEDDAIAAAAAAAGIRPAQFIREAALARAIAAGFTPQPVPDRVGELARRLKAGGAGLEAQDADQGPGEGGA